MALLTPSEYDASYFEGGTQVYTHNAGYTNYSRIQYNIRGSRPEVPIEESTGTTFGDLIKGLNIKLNGQFIGRSVLVVGCAYGFEVEGFRALGVDAVGVDVSAFAISQAKPEIQPYLEVADIRTKILTYGNRRFDYIFSRWFLETMSDVDLQALIPEMKRVARRGQCHIVNPYMNSEYYNVKTFQGWIDLFDVLSSNTVLIANDDFDNYVIV